MSRVLILANEHVNRRMAGPAIRCYEFARQLAARGHVVTLASPFPSDLPEQSFPVLVYEDDTLERLAATNDVTVMQGYVLMRHPELRDAAPHLVVDLYDPFPLENLIQLQRAPSADRDALHALALGAVNDQVGQGDFFLCASEKQRDFWLGWLCALNRVNPRTHADDAGLRSLLDVVAFGVPSEPPRREGTGLRGAFEAVREGDVVLLWGGGIYDWFDPVTLIRAVAAVVPDVPRLRLVFMSTGHPNPLMPEMAALVAARRATAELGLEGRHVLFHEGWVPYAERAAWLLDADIGVSTHVDHVETRFSFRTRILDYLWAGLPVVCTGGDTLGDLVERERLGRTAPAGDETALAAAICALAGDAEERRSCAERSRRLATTLAWERTTAPLAAYCDHPRRAPDLPTPAGRSVAGRLPP